MGLFDKFPWVNTHELNLNWIIQKMKEWGKESAENVSAAKTAAENAAENAAAAVEPFARRAETASGNAEASAARAETASENAEASAARAETASGNAEASAARAETASENAEASAAIWPYTGNYLGYLYKTLPVTDPYTNTDREFLTAPQENDVLYRVSGRVPKRFSYDDNTDKNYHYEKIIKMEGAVNATDKYILFGDSVYSNYDGLNIAEAENIGMVILDKQNQTVLKYSKLPAVDSLNIVDYVVISNEFCIPDDSVLNMYYNMGADNYIYPSDYSNIEAYLYIRMKYTF